MIGRRRIIVAHSEKIERSTKMTAPKEMLTSQKFAERAGVSASTVSKWLKSGKVKGVKQSGKWMISTDQLAGPDHAKPAQVPATPAASKAATATAPAAKPVATGRAYSVEEFSAMTYLTTYGVERFLKEGRLTGHKDENGKWSVDHSNVDLPSIRHLLRK
jgi:hypothetical protein